MILPLGQAIWQSPQPTHLCSFCSLWGFVLSFVGFLAFVGVVLTHNFKAAVLAAPSETASAVTTIDSIGRNMLSSGDNGYLLPFEAVSVLLLACIVGALMIARKR